MSKKGHLPLIPTTFQDIAAWARTVATTINGIVRGGPFLLTWKDNPAPLSSAADGGSNVPSFSAFVNGTKAYEFSQSADNELFVSFHVNHDYALGTYMFPHVHWATTATAGVVRWGVEYTVARGHQQEAFPTATTIYLEQSAQAVALTHCIAGSDTANALDGAALAIEPDALILVRVFRDWSHANDTLSATAFGLAVNLHYQANLLGTPQKAPDFYS